MQTSSGLAAMAIVLAALAGCGGGAGTVPAAPGGARPAAAVGPPRALRQPPFRFYSPASFWNRPVPASAALDPRSAAIVASLADEVEAEEAAGSGPAINTSSYSVAVYTVPRDQPTVRVTLDNAHAPALQAAWRAVPVPAGAKPAAGTDGTMVIWQPATDRLWDFWRAVEKPDGWHAAWGGATRRVSEASGVYGPSSWPGAKRSWGTSAASIGVVGGLVTLEDLELGVVNHALQMALPRVRAGVYALPAARTDGQSHDPLALPEGAHLRLDPRLNLAALQLPRLTLILARAAQRYGIVVNNRAANVAFYAQDPTPTGTDPYRGPDGYFEGSYPRRLLARFPWRHLQLLRMRLRAQR